jgi:hypothetical protein
MRINVVHFVLLEGTTAAQHALELPNDQIACDRCLGHEMTQKRLLVVVVVFVHPSRFVGQLVVASRLASVAIVSEDLPYSECSAHL